MTTFKNFDGIGRPNRPGDNMLLLTAGLSFSIGKSGWKRVVDAGPYMLSLIHIYTILYFISKYRKNKFDEW